MAAYRFAVFAFSQLVLLVVCHPQHMLQNSSILEDKDHLRVHAKEVDYETISAEERRFIYYKSHDFDSNSKLDGCELVQSIIHFHGEGRLGDYVDAGRVFPEEELELTVDAILRHDDMNFDGFIDYGEFVSSLERLSKKYTIPMNVTYE